VARRIFVYRDGKIVEVTELRNRHNLRTVGKEEMDRRDSIMVIDDLRQDYQKSSDRDRLAYEKAMRERGNR